MFKRHFIIDLLALGLAVLAGLVWSNSDQSDYADLLSHGGLSEQALVYKSTSTARVSDAVAKLDANKKLQNYQVHFAATGHLTYFYAKGSYTGVPLISGQHMGAKDYKASLPVAVVGRNVADKAYTTPAQKYLQLDGRYLPIVGVVGTRKDNALNDQVFISASSGRKTFDPELKDVEILVDGADAQQTKAFSQAFGGAKPRRILYSKAQTHTSWWRRNAKAMLSASGVLVLMALVGMLAAMMSPRPQTTGLDSALRNHYLSHMTRRDLAGVTVALAVGTGIVWWRFYLTNHFRLLVFITLMLVVFTLSHQFFIRRRSFKEAARGITN